MNACASRSTLISPPECFSEGEVRICESACGAGEEICENEEWSECLVPLIEEECENSCGSGLRTCSDEVWSECSVEPLELACENDCGRGIQSCRDNQLEECVVESVVETCSNKCGSGTRSCDDNLWNACSAPAPLAPSLKATLRDFNDVHPDMELGINAPETGIVQQILGVDGKPVYSIPSSSISTTGVLNFEQWYNDVAGVNLSQAIELPLVASALDSRLYRFESSEFFPIDEQLFGNQGRNHNFHFTLEAEGSFVYQGGEVFRFTGDDDFWVFMNGLLVMDLGGLHESLSDEVFLDDIAQDVGMVLGNEYPLKLFFAERQTLSSRFEIETSIGDIGVCP